MLLLTLKTQSRSIIYDQLYILWNVKKHFLTENV
jgi:hypothetical protein